MPRPDQASMTVSKELHERIERVCTELGYGERGRHKFLNRVLDIVEALPVLFKAQ